MQFGSCNESTLENIGRVYFDISKVWKKELDSPTRVLNIRSLTKSHY